MHREVEDIWDVGISRQNGISRQKILRKSALVNKRFSGCRHQEIEDIWDTGIRKQKIIMIINDINNISNKSFSLNSVQGFRDSTQGNARGNNISGSIGGFGLTDKISSKPISEIDAQNIKLKEACTQFEQIFIKYMVDKMWSSTDAGSGKQSAEKSVWQDYFNNEISKVIAESSMTGISETLFDQLGAFGSVGQQALPVEGDIAAEAEASIEAAIGESNGNMAADSDENMAADSDENMAADSEIII